MARIASDIVVLGDFAEMDEPQFVTSTWSLCPLKHNKCIDAHIIAKCTKCSKHGKKNPEQGKENVSEKKTGLVSTSPSPFLEAHTPGERKSS